MKARVLILSAGFCLLSLFTVNAYGQQQPRASEETNTRIDNLESQVKDLQRQYSDAHDDTKQIQQQLNEARDKEKKAQESLREAERALNAEKKALKAREKADKAVEAVRQED